MKKPNLFIVGCGRGGTTSIHEWLKIHPEVFMSEVKGPNFFGNEPNPAFPEYFKNEKKYLSLFLRADGKKIVGESSHYFWSETAPTEIKKFNSSSKIVIILRNPADVAFSYYKSGTIPNDLPFEESINQDNEKINILWKKLSFHKNLNNYLKIFGKKNVHIIIFEDMAKDPKKVYENLCRFLKINPKFLPEFEVHNKARELKNKWFLWLLQICPTQIKLFIKKKMPGKTNNIRARIIKFTTKRQIRDSMDFKVRKTFNLRFKDEIQKTSKLVDRNLSHWLN